MSAATGRTVQERRAVLSPPLLRIAGSGGGFVLSWPDPSTGFKLQSTATVGSPASWTDVPQPVVVVGGDKTVTVPAAGQYQFYRLLKP